MSTTARPSAAQLAQFVLDRFVASDIDARTGLFNARYFEGLLLRRVEMARRGECGVSVLRLDLDHFKQVNDTFGHGVGDELLSELGRLFGVRARSKTDCVARVGGDEFAVLLWATGLSGALHKAEVLRREVETRLSAWLSERTGQTEARITASLGVATLELEAEAHGPGSPDSANAADTADAADVACDLYARADRLQYLAKRRGRNRVEWDLAMVTAEERAQMALHVQPIRLGRHEQMELNVDVSAEWGFPFPQRPSRWAEKSSRKYAGCPARSRTRRVAEPHAARARSVSFSEPRPCVQPKLSAFGKFKQVVRSPIVWLVLAALFFGPCIAGSDKRDKIPQPVPVGVEMDPSKCIQAGAGPDNTCGDVPEPPRP